MQTGVGDVGAATECREHDGCHFWEDTCYLEHLDPDGADRSATASAASWSSTTLIDKIAPLVRYRSDDLVRLTREQCACGRTHGRVWPLGRKGDEVVVDGTSVLPGDLWAAVEGSPRDQRRAVPGDPDRARGRPAATPRRLRDEGPKGLADLRTRVTDAVHEARRRDARGRARRERGAAAPGPAAQDPAGGEGMRIGMTFAAAYEDPPASGASAVSSSTAMVTIPWPVAQPTSRTRPSRWRRDWPRSGSAPATSCSSWRCCRRRSTSVPFEKAAGKLGALYSSADATPFDAFRTAALVRQLEPAGRAGDRPPACSTASTTRGATWHDVFASVARAWSTADDDARTRLRRGRCRRRGDG